MKINSRTLKLISLLYMYIPVVIFLFGYTRWYYAVATTVILIVCLYRYMADKGNYSYRGLYDVDAHMDGADSEKGISLEPSVVAFSLILIAGVSILVGIGGLLPQSGDWEKHNAVLNDLIEHSWPVYYDRFGKCMLTYYLGQYIVPAVAGKITGSFMVANIVMAILSIAGLWLVYLMLVELTGADKTWKQIATVFVMLFFCGGLVLVQFILKLMYGDRMYSLGSQHWVLVDGIMLQYRSNLVMIRWVLPQIIVPWLAAILLIKDIKKVRYYVLILLPSLLFGSFSFAALAVIGVAAAVRGLLNQDITIKKILSLENILLGLSLGSILFFYFLGNLQVDKPINSSFRFEIYDIRQLPVYLFFCLIMFGVYYLCVAPEHKGEPLFYINLAILLILPWFRMGLCNDVVMSGSIPSLFILMIMVLELLFDERESTSLGLRKGIVIAMMLVGLIYPIDELKDNISWNTLGPNLATDYGTMELFTRRGDPRVTEDLMYNYYTYDLDGKVFYEYMAKTK